MMAIADALSALFGATLSGGASVLLVLCLRHPLRRAFGARVAYLAWAAVPLAIAMVLLPAASVPPAVEWLLVVPGTSALGALESRVNAATWAQEVAVLLLWASGAMVAMALFVARQFRFERMLGQVRRQEDGTYVAQMSAGLPAVIGILHPRIVLPADHTIRFDNIQQQLVREHERLHIARGDQIANLLVVALRCLFWFNPLLHWAAPRFRQDQELACDARVIARHPDARRAYGEALLNAQIAAAIAPLSCQIGFGHPLKERIAMLRRPLPTTARRVAGISAVLAFAAVAGCAANTAHTPPSVVDKPVRFKWTTLPEYPAQAMADGIAGMVKLAVDVRADGTLRKVKVVSSAPAGVFDATATEAVKHMSFEPATRNGKPVAARIVIPVKFDLDSHDGAVK